MGKKCIICKEEAKYAIKGTNDFYCKSCAEENFDDVQCLETVDERESKENKIKDILPQD